MALAMVYIMCNNIATYMNSNVYVPPPPMKTIPMKEIPAPYNPNYIPYNPNYQLCTNPIM